MTPQLPKDLSGLQKLADHVIVQEGDVWVYDGRPVMMVGDAWFGEKVSRAERHADSRIYRRIPLPRQHCEVEAFNALAGSEPNAEDVPAHSNPPFEATTKVTVNPPDKALTHDGGKPPLACLPLKALREVAMVQLYGHRKYGDFYNYKKGMELSRNASCAMRHIADYMDGQDNDAESGRSHLAHAACRLLFMLENLAEGKATDDRFKP